MKITGDVLLFNALINADETDDTDPYYYLDEIFENPSFRKKSVRAGDCLGQFTSCGVDTNQNNYPNPYHRNRIFGLDILIDRVGFNPTLEIAKCDLFYNKPAAQRLPTDGNINKIIDAVPNSSLYDYNSPAWDMISLYKKQEGLGYMDPCAFFGTFVNNNPTNDSWGADRFKLYIRKTTYLDSNGHPTFYKRSGEDIYSEVLVGSGFTHSASEGIFENKNKVYIDIRDQWGRVYGVDREQSFADVSVGGGVDHNASSNIHIQFDDDIVNASLGTRGQFTHSPNNKAGYLVLDSQSGSGSNGRSPDLNTVNLEDDEIAIIKLSFPIATAEKQDPADSTTYKIAAPSKEQYSIFARSANNIQVVGDDDPVSKPAIRELFLDETYNNTFDGKHENKRTSQIDLRVANTNQSSNSPKKWEYVSCYKQLVLVRHPSEIKCSDLNPLSTNTSRKYPSISEFEYLDNVFRADLPIGLNPGTSSGCVSRMNTALGYVDTHRSNGNDYIGFIGSAIDGTGDTHGYITLFSHNIYNRFQKRYLFSARNSTSAFVSRSASENNYLQYLIKRFNSLVGGSYTSKIRETLNQGGLNSTKLQLLEAHVDVPGQTNDDVVEVICDEENSAFKYFDYIRLKDTDWAIIADKRDNNFFSETDVYISFRFVERCDYVLREPNDNNDLSSGICVRYEILLRGFQLTGTSSPSSAKLIEHVEATGVFHYNFLTTLEGRNSGNAPSLYTGDAANNGYKYFDVNDPLEGFPFNHFDQNIDSKVQRIESDMYLVRGMGMSLTEYCLYRNYIQNNIEKVWGTVDLDASTNFTTGDGNRGLIKAMQGHSSYDALTTPVTASIGTKVNMFRSLPAKIERVRNKETYFTVDLRSGRSEVERYTGRSADLRFFLPNPDYNSNEPAHEFGHVLGLTDRYGYVARVPTSPVGSILENSGGSAPLYVETDDDYNTKYGWLHNIMSLARHIPSNNVLTLNEKDYYDLYYYEGPGGTNGNGRITLFITPDQWSYVSHPYASEPGLSGQDTVFFHDQNAGSPTFVGITSVLSINTEINVCDTAYVPVHGAPGAGYTPPSSPPSNPDDGQMDLRLQTSTQNQRPFPASTVFNNTVFGRVTLRDANNLDDLKFGGLETYKILISEKVVTGDQILTGSSDVYFNAQINLPSNLTSDSEISQTAGIQQDGFTLDADTGGIQVWDFHDAGTEDDIPAGRFIIRINSHENRLLIQRLIESGSL